MIDQLLRNFAAIAIEEEWGSELQIEAENNFFATAQTDKRYHGGNYDQT